MVCFERTELFGMSDEGRVCVKWRIKLTFRLELRWADKKQICTVLASGRRG